MFSIHAVLSFFTTVAAELELELEQLYLHTHTQRMLALSFDSLIEAVERLTENKV